MDPEHLRYQTRDLDEALPVNYITEYEPVIFQDIRHKLFSGPFYLKDEEDMAKLEAAGPHIEICSRAVGTAAR